MFLTRFNIGQKSGVFRTCNNLGPNLMGIGC